VLSRTGDAIRQARSARGISEAELAKDIGISKEFLSAMEAGQKRPTLEILLLIALRLEIAPKQIYGTIGDNPKAARLTAHSDMIMDLYEAAKKIRR
jgi:transcriptional regulator with XRE-family HTH domain